MHARLYSSGEDCIKQGRREGERGGVEKILNIAIWLRAQQGGLAL